MRSSVLYDPIRKKNVEATPEEQVRQAVIRHLIELGYPKAHIAVEKELSTLPHLKGLKLPKRRADILVFKKEGSDLIPWILIECKEGEIGAAAKRQLIGYNYYVKAPFIALANSKEMICGFLKNSAYAFVAGLPKNPQP